MVWLFCSPHHTRDNDGGNKESASAAARAVLDRQLGTYFCLRMAGNVCITAGAFVNCTSWGLAAYVLAGVNLFSFFGVSLVGTNLLAHRYLVS
jgi:hypothetical protein